MYFYPKISSRTIAKKKFLPKLVKMIYSLKIFNNRMFLYLLTLKLQKKVTSTETSQVFKNT